MHTKVERSPSTQTGTEGAALETKSPFQGLKKKNDHPQPRWLYMDPMGIFFRNPEKHL